MLSKVTIKKYVLSSFLTVLWHPVVVCVVGKLLYSSSTWWVIVAQYADFKKSQESRPLLTTALQTATFSY